MGSAFGSSTTSLGMSGNLGGFRSSPVGFADGLLTFPGMGFSEYPPRDEGELGTKLRPG